MHNQGALGYLEPGGLGPGCIACTLALGAPVLAGFILFQRRSGQVARQHAGPHLGELAVHGFHHFEAHGIGYLQPGERKRSAFPRGGGKPTYQRTGDFPFGSRPLFGGFTTCLQHPDAALAYVHFKLVAAHGPLNTGIKRRTEPHISHAKIRTLQVRLHLLCINAAPLDLRARIRIVALKRRLGLVSCRCGIARCNAAATGYRQCAGKEHDAFLYRGPVHVRRLPNGRGGM